MAEQPASEEKSTVRDQRDRFLAFAFASADLFIEISEESRVTHAHGATKGITGVDEKALVGKKWLELFSVYEQSILINAFERSKPGMRVGPMLVNLSEALGARKAILTGIKMPGSNKFYVTLGISNAIMARIAHALNHQQGFEILTKEIFVEAVQSAIVRCRTTGQEICLTYFDFFPTRMERTRMGEGPWMKMRESLGEMLIAEAFDGYTTGEIGDGRYGIIHDRRLPAETLHKKVMEAIKESDPSGGGFPVKIKSLPIDISKLNERETEPAITYTVNEFAHKGADLPFHSLNAAFSAYIASSTPMVKEFKALVERSGFSLHFQPIVDLRTNTAAHFETYCHFETGNTKTWVKFAEDVGLAPELDKAMYERAINHIKFKAGGTWTKFSVNLSMRSLEDNDFVKEFFERLEVHKNLAERLIFEITDSKMAQHQVRLIKFISNIKALGFKVALDHYSPEPAYANLIKKLNPNIVKIDGSYVRRMSSSPRDAGLVRSLAETCQSLGIDVIAKWVEEKAHADMLKDMDIHFAQGFYFGRPGAKPDYIPPKE
jgi:EAL domain-containing protein (putative c-di-GMP-specific phosphodiesterase class I)